MVVPSAIASVLAEPETGTATRQQTAAAAVQTADEEDKPKIAAAAVEQLEPKERKELIESFVPQDSKDRRAVYVWGFVISAILALGLASIAWGASETGNSGVATAAIAAALSLPSAIIGGLLGAYATRT